MPLPFIFIGIAVATGLTGIGAGTKAGFDFSKAKSINENAAERISEGVSRLDTTRKQCGKSLEALGEEKLFILQNSLLQFVKTFTRIKNVDFTDSVGLDELQSLHIDKKEFGELREMENVVLSLTGGVPKYLEEIRPELTVDENFRRLCFLPRSLLFREFDETFSNVFGSRVATRGRLLRLLADGSRTVSELARQERRTVNGSYSEALRDLCYAGFVAEESGICVSEARGLKDNYARFYLKNIEPRAAAIKAGLFEFASLEQLNGWDSILGLQFENLILNHVNDLFPHLGLEKSLVLSAAPYVQNATKRNEGCQIDLLLRTERTLMVVEIKRQREIRHEVVDEVAEKVKKLRYDKGLSVRTALVYDGRLSASVPADRYFDFIVPAEALLA